MCHQTRRIFKEDFHRCISQIREVDEDDAKWQAMVRAPVTKSGKYSGSVFDIEVYAKQMVKVLRNANSYLID